MCFNELAKKRLSVRGFTGKNIPDDMIAALLEAAVQAPSGRNCQPWHFYVIKDKTILKQINETAYRAAWFSTAPLVITVCADLSRAEQSGGERGRSLYCIQDTAAAIQNILLCAADLELGACWCGAYDETAVRKILKLKEDMRPVALIPVGYPNGADIKPGRRPIDEVTTFIGSFFAKFET